MFTPKNAAGALLVLGLMSWTAAPAQAFCGWFGKCCGGTTAYYPPVVAQPVIANYAPACAPACSPCGGGCAPYTASYAPACNSCQTVNYVPQTAYRTVYYNAPVVAYSPVAACGPCGQTTVMRPVTTYVTQARVVPYTMYRPVVAAMPVSAPVTAAYYAPVAQPVAAPACCGAAYRAAPAPVMPAAAPLGMPGTMVPSLAPAAAPSAPTPAEAPTYAPNAAPLDQAPPAGSAPSPYAPPAEQPSRTFDASPTPDPQSRMVLPPRGDSTSAPRALDPEDRTTALPLRQGWSVRNASSVTPVKAPSSTQDDGWRAAR